MSMRKIKKFSLDLSRYRCIFIFMKTKSFRIAAVSSNANSFGLRQCIMMPRTGKAWKVLKSICQPWTKGQDIKVPIVKDQLQWARVGVECPEEIDLLPPKTLVKEVYSV